METIIISRPIQQLLEVFQKEFPIMNSRTYYVPHFDTLRFENFFNKVIQWNFKL